MKNKKDKGLNYFQLVTLSVIGVILFSGWHLIFRDPAIFVEPNYQLESVPKINFTFFDSYKYRDFDTFQRADDNFPIQEYSETRNPFSVPDSDAESSDPWRDLFSIVFEVNEEEGLYLTNPEIEDPEPTLYLHEGRQYSLQWGNSESGDYFALEDSEGEYIIQDEEGFNFTANTEMKTYFYSGEIQSRGGINLIE